MLARVVAAQGDVVHLADVHQLLGGKEADGHPQGELCHAGWRQCGRALADVAMWNGGLVRLLTAIEPPRLHDGVKALYSGAMHRNTR